MPWFLWLWAHSGWSSLLSRLSTSPPLPSGLWPLAWCWTVDLPPQALLGECVVQNYTWLFIMEEEYPIAVKVLEKENANWRASTVAPFPPWNSALQTWLSPTKFQVVKPGLYQTPAALQRERTSKSQTQWIESTLLTRLEQKQTSMFQKSSHIPCCLMWFEVICRGRNAPSLRVAPARQSNIDHWKHGSCHQGAGFLKVPCILTDILPGSYDYNT